jgi:methylated-DNA-[protein]-cysteine S-methyltransferase
MSNKTVYTTIDSPIGPILLVGDGPNLTQLNFQAGTNPTKIRADWQQDSAPFAEAVSQLQAYFAGELRLFDLPLRPKGTPFQQQVWQQLRAIPYGETRSYGALAQRLGKPGAARAVGLANGANPLPLIVPCHRVIGSNGRLTGYGGGLAIKEALLNLERAEE